MIKKLGYIIVSLLLLTVTAGYSVSKHYCGPRLVSVSINHEAKSCCDMEGTSSCCRNETKVFQLDEDYVISSVLEQMPVKSLNLFLTNYIQINFNLNTLEQSVVFIPESPPPKKQQTILSGLQCYLC